MSSLPKAVTCKRTGLDSDPRPFGSQATVTPYRPLASRAKTAEPINMPFEVLTRVGRPRTAYYTRGSDPPRKDTSRG